MNQPLLKLESLSKAFADELAVADLSLDIAAGELFSLLGPSGSGKSTLLRLLAGLETPDSGRILLDGQDITAMPAHQRPLNMMFQRYALFPHMTVADNVAYGVKRLGWPRQKVRDRVHELLELVDLVPYAQRRPEQLSGGQQQRVALARALARAPSVLLLDEPLSALDRRLRETTALELRRLQRETGTTFIMVTHDQDEAMTLSSRVAVMFDGRIAQTDTPQQLYEAPRTREVAAFVGEANFVDGVVTRQGEGMLHVDAGELGTFCVACSRSIGAGTAVTLGVRPERTRLRSNPGKRNVLTGSVEGQLYHGDVSVLHIRARDSRIWQCRRPNVGSSEPAAVETGATCWLDFDPTDAFVLTE